VLLIKNHSTSKKELTIISNLLQLIKKITSPQNDLVKYLIKLQEKSAFRKKEQLFLIEGVREVDLAIGGGYEFDKLFFCPDIFSGIQEFIEKVLPETEIIEISLSVYQKLAYRSDTEGLLAVAKMKTNTLEDLYFKSENPLILVVESPEKPGNLGALLRTADAARLDAVIVANPTSDFYNPNVIRSSVGTVFTNILAAASTAEVIAFLQKNNIHIFAAALTVSEPYHLQNFTQPSAIVVGTEATGLTQPWLEASAKNIIIPMEGAIDSLNLSVSASILIFEAKRQRGWCE